MSHESGLPSRGSLSVDISVPFAALSTDYAIDILPIDGVAPDGQRVVVVAFRAGKTDVSIFLSLRQLDELEHAIGAMIQDMQVTTNDRKPA